ncbi:hypothetical protein [Alteriqipengyuania sp.]|uniref:hypothetical protein n=1 Tax=Alteriqipengyuania sp. TaxID=2800692 RepID=UPI0035115976
MKPIVPLALLAAFALQGCIAKTALDIATAPVKVAGRAVDMATTSQSEADEKRGREIRRREEQLAKLERRYREQREDCEDGDRKACEKARETYEDIQEILPSVPYEPRR